MSIHHLRVLAVTALLVLGGCDAATPAPTGTTAAPSAGGCDGLADALQQRLARPGVQRVTVEGPCQTVIIATTLSDGDTQQARQLCDLASATAYTGGISGIRVDGGTRQDLARGVKGSQCG